MKTLIGHYCSRCRAVVLDRRNKMPPFCPACRTEGNDNSAIEEIRVTVLRLDKNDFPKKNRDLPGQLGLFEEPTASMEGGLF